MIVDGGYCIMCEWQDPIIGICTKHGYDAMDMSDKIRDCDDYKEVVL